MKIRIARKIVDQETHGAKNPKWVNSNSRGTLVSPWRYDTRLKAFKRLKEII